MAGRDDEERSAPGEAQMILNDIKVGDEVALRDRFGHNWSFEKVERVTGSQVILSTDRRYWKKNGRRVGESDSWRSERIEAITAEHHAILSEQTERLRKSSLIRQITGMSYRQLEARPIQQLKTACVALGLPVTHKE